MVVATTRAGTVADGLEEGAAGAGDAGGAAAVARRAEPRRNASDVTSSSIRLSFAG